jgi:hypothetical protein
MADWRTDSEWGRFRLADNAGENRKHIAVTHGLPTKPPKERGFPQPDLGPRCPQISETRVLQTSET